MASTGQQLMITGPDNAPHLIKLEEDANGIQTMNTTVSDPSPLLQTVKSPSVTPIPANSIKSIVQTSNGQYIIIPANGGQAFIQSAIVTSQPTFVSLPRPIISTPQPITVARVADSKVLVRSVPSAVSAQQERVIQSISSASDDVTTLTSNAQRQVTASMQMGDIFSAIASQVNKSLTRQPASGDSQGVSYVTTAFTDGSDGQIVSVPNEQAQTEIVHSASGLSQSSPQFSSETGIHSSPSVTYIRAPPPIKRMKVTPAILKSGGAKSPVVLSSEHVQISPVAVSQTQGEMFTQSLSSLPQNGTKPELTDLQLDDGSQLLIHQVGNDDAAVETVTSAGGVPQQYVIQDPVVQDDRPPCPVCGDKISGYHYGIFTCESCKGFFKRTVQNKKAFICHRKGECDINVLARKKCPACRFKRCLLAGMKLEAVREDRQRGGRSSYDGAQNYARARQALGVTSPRRVIVKRPSPAPVKKTILLPTENGGQLITMVYPDGSDVPSAFVHEQKPPTLQPHRPALLEDLMAVEALMSEEEAEQECCRGKFMEGDDNLFVSLLHFADHCLYKIVRWARNLPDFASVSTDDQILLLQNCWGELLCLCCCWNSLRCDNEIRIAGGRALNMEIATLLGIEEMAERLLDYITHLRELELDSHEFIALKAMLLLNPDVKNLRDDHVIRQHQDRLSGALMIYSASHYQDKSNKCCELLCRLPELSRLSALGKDILKSRQSQGDLPQYSLLSELLKGDSVVQT